MSADGPVRPTGQTAGPGQASRWPVWSGPVPPLAEGFTARPDTVPDLETALVPGVTVVLVPDQAAASAQDWRASSGKTQLARFFAESLWRSPGVDVLTWVVASSRASVLSGFGAAATAIGTRYMGAERAGEFGKRNGVPGELVVRLRPIKVLANFDITG